MLGGNSPWVSISACLVTAFFPDYLFKDLDIANTLGRYSVFPRVRGHCVTQDSCGMSHVGSTDRVWTWFTVEEGAKVIL